MDAYFEVEADGMFVVDTITDDTIVLNRANELYTSMKKMVEGTVSLRMVIRTDDGYEIVLNMR